MQMSKCKHFSCDKFTHYDLCYYHYQEMIHNGEKGRWNCEWCAEYKHNMEMIKNMKGGQNA